MDKVLSMIKDAVNILFFVITATIGILTYLKARKTILQPIKTEVFKVQLKVFSELMELFNGKSEYEIRSYFHLEKVLTVNAIALLDNYAKLFFDYKPDIEKRPYNKSDCPTMIVKWECMEKNFDIDDKPTRDFDDERVSETNKPDPMTRAAIWNNEKVGVLSIPKEYTMAEKKIEEIIKSPVLPKDCVLLLKEIEDIAKYNIDMIMTVLDEISNEIPSKYPNIESLKKLQLGWIHNRYIDKIKSFEDITLKLTDYLRSYLLIDSLKE